MNKCEFSISCPKCHKLPPLFLSIENSLLLNKTLIKSKCPCSKYEILSQNLKEFYVECSLEKKESPSIQNWELHLSKAQIKSKDSIIEKIQNEQSHINLIYKKIIKQIETLEDLFSKMRIQVEKLFKWDESLKKELLIFCPKLIDDFFISKHTIYNNPMENYSNFINNNLDPVTQHFLKIFPDLDNSYKVINKIFIENKSIIDSLSYKILIKKDSIIIENEKQFVSYKNPVMIPKYGYSFQYDKFKKKFNYSQSYKYTNAHFGTIENICELNNGNIASCGNDLTIKLWQKYSNEPYSSLFGHTGNILSVLQLKNGLLASASSDKTIRIWDIKILQPVKILTEHQESVIKLYQMNNSKFVSCSLDGTLRIWDPLQNYTSILLKGHKDVVKSVIELQPGVIASCSLDEHIRIWNTYMKKCQKKINVKKALVDIDYYSITGHLLVISNDKRLMMINYELGQKIKEYISNNELYCICHSIDGKIFLGCNLGEVKILNKDFQNITTLKIHNDVVSSIKIFRNQMLCTSSWDGSFAISI